MTATASPAPHDSNEGPEPTPTRPESPKLSSPPDSPISELSSLSSEPELLDEHFLSPSFSKTNGHALPGHGLNDGDTPPATLADDPDAPPSKRRRVRDATPPPRGTPKKKPESPPWKKFEADGPTTITENGKRRSGRTNAVPIELPPPGKKRLTRGATNDGPGTPAARDTRRPGNATSASKKTQAASKAPAPAKTSNKRSAPQPMKPPPRPRRRSPSPKPQPISKRAVRPSRSTRNLRRSSDAVLDDTPRIPLTEIPLVHPNQVNVPPGQTIARPKVSASFEEYIERAPAIDVKDGGWLDSADDGPPYTEEMAQRDASVLLRAEKETEPGGILSEGVSALFVPDPIEEPPRQWAHVDHLIKQMANFRKLMVMEHQRHKQTAKRLAEACRDEWIRRQPKSAEQIEAEERATWIGRYRVVVKAFAGTWENVKTEVNRRRLEEWEVAEQKRVKAALNEAVNMSELKLQARQAHADSVASSDEDEDEDEDAGLSDEDEMGLSDDADVDEGLDLEADSHSHDGLDDEDVMSSSEDEEDAKSTVSDEGLTQEQLREKYAHVPDFTPSGDAAQHEGDQQEEPSANTEDQGDTSDESVDMDDDLGSSDEDMDSDESEKSDAGGDQSDEGESEADEEPSGLLGMLFGKSELKQMKEPQDGDVEMNDAPMSASNPDTEQQGLVNHEGREETLARDSGAVNGERMHDASETTTVNGTKEHGVSKNGPEGDDATPKSDPQDSSFPTETSAADKAVTHKMDIAADALPVPDSAMTTETEQATTNLITNGDHAMKVDPVTPVEPHNDAVEPSIETAVVSPTQRQPSPDTEAPTNPPTRDQSQTPRTSETKPSEVDTTSSAVKANASRSGSPPASGGKTEVPFLLRGTLREYQHDGLDWLAGLYRNRTNGILADEMGLGKTIQTIALLAHLACHHETWGPHLVVVPTSVMLNWEMEFKKWCPGFKVLSYYGSIEERKRKRQGWKSNDIWNVCITSYQIVLQDQQVFRRRQWHYMILDEAHNIKNFKSKRWQTLLGFNTQARLLLTGTPLQNNLTELWSLLFFLMPSENGVGGFADLAEFQDWFHKPESQILESGREQMDEEARAIISKLHKVLRPYLLRRLKADVEKQMPAKYEHVEFCRLSRRQRELYDGFLSRADTRQALSSGNYISVINCLMQLRKVCNHPDLFVERPIMTSFRQPKSVASDYEGNESLVRRLLAPNPIDLVSKEFLNLVPTAYEGFVADVCTRVSRLASQGALIGLRETQRGSAHTTEGRANPSTVASNIEQLDSAAKWGRLEELQHCIYVNELRSQQQPIYGKRLTDFLTLGVNHRPHKPRPKIPKNIMNWFEEDSAVFHDMVPTLDERAASMKPTISKFACITPAVVNGDMSSFVLGSRGVDAFTETDLRLSAPVRRAPFMQKERPLDPWHEARMRLSIQFPDKRLLQYDCGKLQALDKLLRKLQSGGHRALIFTQMTKVLDLLEQFLNIHGHKYLRLDGATKVEQRQILTDRFNNDDRILCFILSTRSGGLGINLTGADTVIFYDQDWNPAMDKQCQDRCHRIGQTRDVHIYRLVSEHTIEANILRKASQKQMLDDVVIQEGGFTTDYFNKITMREVMSNSTDQAEDVVGDAMDRVLGGVETSDQRTVNRVLEQAEDREDVAAARVAQKEIHEDEADFDEKPAATAPTSGDSSTRQGTPVTRETSNAPGVGRSNLGLFSESADPDEAMQEEAEVEYSAMGEKVQNIDDYMVATMTKQLEGTPLELPKDKKKGKSKKGKDTRRR